MISKNVTQNKINHIQHHICYFSESRMSYEFFSHTCIQKKQHKQKNTYPTITYCSGMLLICKVLQFIL